MVKGNNSLKNKSHQSSKPYDVSNVSRINALFPAKLLEVLVDN